MFSLYLVQDSSQQGPNITCTHPDDYPQILERHSKPSHFDLGAYRASHKCSRIQNNDTSELMGKSETPRKKNLQEGSMAYQRKQGLPFFQKAGSSYFNFYKCDLAFLGFLGFTFLSFFFVACSNEGSGRSSSNAEPADVPTKQQCDIKVPHGIGEQTRVVKKGEEPGEWGHCILARCKDAYTKDNGACYETRKACTSSEVTNVDTYGMAGTRSYRPSSNDYASCVLTSCNSSYTLGNDGACHETTVNCTGQELTDAHTTDGTKTYRSDGSGYANCIPATNRCVANYTYGNNECHETTADCTATITNSASATKIYTTGNGYSACTLVSCNTGYVKDGNSCRTPADNSYAHTNGDERTCTGPTIIHVLKLGGQAMEVSNSGQCPFTCQTGYIINTSDRTCDVPATGKYANASGREATCTGPTIANVLKLGGQAVGVSNSGQCPFTCQTGYIVNGRVCAQPLTAGGTHTCAILDDGSVKCWGNHEYGQLGMGGINQQNTAIAKIVTLLKQLGLGKTAQPQAVSLGTGKTAKAITAGDNHTCTILNDNSVKCWGDNLNGQLGLGNDGDGTERDTPQAVDLGVGKTAKAITAGKLHTCAILNDNSVKCWGDNPSGQLGLRSTTLQNTPQAVSLGSSKTAKAITAGDSHTCAILNDNSVKCWGENTHGHLGLGNHGNDTNRKTPQAVNLGVGKTAKAITAGWGHTCAILNDNSVKCWGENTHGQLGLGNTTLQNTPQAVNLGSNTAKAIMAGRLHTCAILNNNSVKCWGIMILASWVWGIQPDKTLPKL